MFNNSDAYWWEGGKKVEAGEQFAPRKLQTNLDKLTRKHAGRRSRTRTDRKRGHYIQARPAGNKTDDIAFDATLRAYTWDRFAARTAAVYREVIECS